MVRHASSFPCFCALLTHFFLFFARPFFLLHTYVTYYLVISYAHALFCLSEQGLQCLQILVYVYFERNISNMFNLIKYIIY